MADEIKTALARYDGDTSVAGNQWSYFIDGLKDAERNMLRALVDRCEQAEAQARNERGLAEVSEEAHGEVRRVLRELVPESPVQAFVDDDVAAAILTERKKREQAEVERDRLRVALKKIAMGTSRIVDGGGSRRPNNAVGFAAFAALGWPDPVKAEDAT